MDRREIIVNDVLNRLSQSTFRQKFHLGEKDINYIREKNLETIKQHAYDFIKKRLAPAIIDNDGKQTPMRGHPVFIAQHATATCCRGCLHKWHHIPPNRNLSDNEINYITSVIMIWIEKEIQTKTTK